MGRERERETASEGGIYIYDGIKKRERERAYERDNLYIRIWRYREREH